MNANFSYGEKKVYWEVKCLTRIRFVTISSTCLTLFVIPGCLFIFCASFALCVFLIFNRCNAILTDKLTRAKEEGLSVKQMLDQTLMEMVNI